MFAQATTIRVPVGAMAQMRRLLEQDYLPQLRQRDGFVSAQLLEQVDDPEAALLIVNWDSQRAVEAFHRTGSLQAAVNALSLQMPGVHVQRTSYSVTIAAENTSALARA